MTFSSIFAIVIGLGMIGQWTMSFISKQIPELETEPIRIWFHIIGELITALALIVSGISLLAGWYLGANSLPGCIRHVDLHRYRQPRVFRSARETVLGDIFFRPNSHHNLFYFQSCN